MGRRQRLTLLRRPADRRQRTVGRSRRRGGSRDRSRLGRGCLTRPAGVRRRHDHINRVTHIGGLEHVRRRGRARDVRTATRTPLPLIRIRRRAVRPRTVRGRQRLTLLRRPRDRRHRSIRRSRRRGGSRDRSRLGRGCLTRPAGVRRRHDDIDRVTHIGGLEHVRRRGRARDVRTATRTPLPLIRIRRRAVRPRTVRGRQRLTLLRRPGDRRLRSIGRGAGPACRRRSVQVD